MLSFSSRKLDKKKPTIGTIGQNSLCVFLDTTVQRSHRTRHRARVKASFQHDLFKLNQRMKSFQIILIT